MNQFHTVCPKTETKFFGKLGNSEDFSAQNKVVSKKKKKKKKKVFTEIENEFSAEIRNSKVFSAQTKVVSKKKRSSPKLRVIFRPISQIQAFEGGCFPMGGLFSIFHKKSASKALKTCDFAYFKSQWGGLEPPPRPPWLRYCQHGLSVRQASKRLGVPRQTLRNHLKTGSDEKRLDRKPLLCVDKLVYLALWTNCF